MPTKIQIAQIDPALGNLDANLGLHRTEITAARESGAEMLLFPELSLTGYFLKDQTAEVALERDSEELEAIREQSKELTIGVGFVERAPDGRLYNAYAIFEDQQLLHVHRKVHLVTYGMFEESRDFAAGDHFEVAQSKHGKLGVLICEDLWHAPSSWLYFLKGVEIFLVPSAGPARGVSAEHAGLGSQNTWSNLLTSTSTLSQSWSIYINRVGCEDGITFAGGSQAIDPFGAQVADLDSLGSGRLTFEVDLRACERARIQTPLRRDEKPWLVLRDLQHIVDPPR